MVSAVKRPACAGLGKAKLSVITMATAKTLAMPFSSPALTVLSDFIRRFIYSIPLKRQTDFVLYVSLSGPSLFQASPQCGNGCLHLRYKCHIMQAIQINLYVCQCTTCTSDRHETRYLQV